MNEKSNVVRNNSSLEVKKKWGNNRKNGIENKTKARIKEKMNAIKNQRKIRKK